ncbi:MAG TPA: hypothetical protein VKB03_14715 [Conexibacter sp.]|nr:hypothetical protein [Conexibacter sp.]
MYRDTTCFEVPLELCALCADLIRARERDHPLVQGTLGRGGVLCGRFTGGRRHWRRVYNVNAGRQAATREIQLDLNLRSSYVEAASKDPIRLQAF